MALLLQVWIYRDIMHTVTSAWHKSLFIPEIFQGRKRTMQCGVCNLILGNKDLAATAAFLSNAIWDRDTQRWHLLYGIDIYEANPSAASLRRRSPLFLSSD